MYLILGYRMQNRFYSDELKAKLSAQLDKICDLVKSENQQHRTDLNDTLENIFCRVLNDGKALKLVNLNKGSIQVAGIDLGDAEAKISYQITAESAASKIHDCLDKFDKEKLYEQYDSLVILFANDYSTKLDNLTLKSYSFDPNATVVLANKNTLKTELGNCEMEKLEAIVTYLDAELSPLIDNPSKSLPVINEILGKCVELMKQEEFATKIKQDLPLHIKEKITLNFEDGDEADMVSRYLMSALPYSSTISDAINSFPDLDPSDLEEYLMDVYNKCGITRNKNPMETLLAMFDYFVPANATKDLAYITWSRRFVLKYFENCTIFKRSKTDKTKLEQAALL